MLVDVFLPTPRRHGAARRAAPAAAPRGGVCRMIDNLALKPRLFLLNSSSAFRSHWLRNPIVVTASSGRDLSGQLSESSRQRLCVPLEFPCLPGLRWPVILHSQRTGHWDEALHPIALSASSEHEELMLSLLASFPLLLRVPPPPAPERPALVHLCPIEVRAPRLTCWGPCSRITPCPLRALLC